MANSNSHFDAIVVGGGPAGIAAALTMAKNGKRVIILEAMSSIGKKLAISGGGRCNFTNALPPAEFAARFGKSQERFVRPALLNYPPQKFRVFLDSIGAPSHAEDGFHFFPVSDRAIDIVRALTAECQRQNIEIHTSTRVASLLIQNNAIIGVKTFSGVEIYSPIVVLATGGKSYPKTGSDGNGYALARSVGHTITPLTPALTGITLAGKFPSLLAGISLPDAELSTVIAGKRYTSRGTLLFTHDGISGTAAMDISGIVAEALTTNKQLALNLNFCAGKTVADWLEKFNLWQRENGKTSIKNLLSHNLPARLSTLLLDGKEFTAATFPAAERRALAQKLVAMELSAIDTGDFDHAMVTHGGVNRCEVNPKTMASKLIQGLFFAGEILDVDGPCGGFNIQWAFSSGTLAGRQKN